MGQSVVIVYLKSAVQNLNETFWILFVFLLINNKGADGWHNPADYVAPNDG